MFLPSLLLIAVTAPGSVTPIVKPVPEKARTYSVYLDSAQVPLGNIKVYTRKDFEDHKFARALKVQAGKEGTVVLDPDDYGTLVFVANGDLAHPRYIFVRGGTGDRRPGIDGNDSIGSHDPILTISDVGYTLDLGSDYGPDVIYEAVLVRNDTNIPPSSEHPEGLGVDGWTANSNHTILPTNKPTFSGSFGICQSFQGVSDLRVVLYGKMTGQTKWTYEGTSNLRTVRQSSNSSGF